jgi:hypothetical protein
MSVYVDDYFARFGRMLLCHMIADSHDELISMAKQIGLPLKHIQYEGTAREHFDVSKQLRARAIQLGAIRVTTRELARMVRFRERPLDP